jgi:thiamine kinase-like enzyme
MEKTLGEAATAAEQDIESALRRVGPWAGRRITYRPVSGGITNTNWRVTVEGNGCEYFVKIPGKGTEMFINRGAAMEASHRAETLGVGPAVFDYLAADGVEISEFIRDRRSCTNADFRDSKIRLAAIDAYRRFHSAERLSLTKTVFDMIDEHIEQARQVGGYFPPDFPWLHKQYRRAREALETSGMDLVPCFNDPMPGNFMVDAGRSIMLIDYEYASNNDRCYDLGTWFGEMFFSETEEYELIEAYFGHITQTVVARVTVHKALADIKWATWAMVQQKISELDFDFFKYGAWKHMRARGVMQDTRWPNWLRRV